MKTEEEIKDLIKRYEDYARDLPSKQRCYWRNKIQELKWVLEN